MKFEEVIQKISTKTNLKRSANAGGEYRGEISNSTLLNAKKQFLEKKRIINILNPNDEKEYKSDLDMKKTILRILLSKENYGVKDQREVWEEELKAYGNQVDEKAKYFGWSDKSKELYDIVLETVLEDKITSFDEDKILRRLRKKLNITFDMHIYLKKKHGRVPLLHSKMKYTNKEDKMINDVLKDLEHQGLIFYISLNNDKYYIIPEEIASILQPLLGIEMKEKNFLLLLKNNRIKNKDKQEFLKKQGLDNRGASEVLNKKILANEFQPSTFLGSLTNDTLTKLLEEQKEKTSGTKSQKIQRLIQVYDTKDTTPYKDPQKQLLQYYVTLAKRDEKNLIKANIETASIGKKFEEATNKLFEELGCTLLPVKTQTANVNADGAAKKNGTHLIWDCKTKKNSFTLSTNERRQFEDYINTYKEKQKNFIFLVITNKIEDKTKIKHFAYSIKKTTGINFTVVSADALHHLYEKSREKKIDISIFGERYIVDTQFVKEMLPVMENRA